MQVHLLVLHDYLEHMVDVGRGCYQAGDNATTLSDTHLQRLSTTEWKTSIVTKGHNSTFDLPGLGEFLSQVRAGWPEVRVFE